MRELKFRVWDKNDNTMKKEVRGYWDLLIDMNGVLHKSMRTSFDVVLISVNFQDALVIQQYTGLKDKNGKEIYEGDVCAYQGYDVNRELFIEKIKIYFCDYIECEHHISEFIGSGFCFNGRRPEELEVIGNIYENPDLLEGVE